MWDGGQLCDEWELGNWGKMKSQRKFSWWRAELGRDRLRGGKIGAVGRELFYFF